MNVSKSLKIWVTGGYFDDSGECFVKEIDIFKKTESDIIRYTPPNNLLVPKKGFTGATWMGEPAKSHLLVCGFSSLYRFSPPKWQLTGILHQPCMNDLHHVSVYNQKIYVVNTGLESIDIFNEEGFFIGSYSFHPAWLNRKRQNGKTPSDKNWKLLLNVGWEGRSFLFTDNPPQLEYYKSYKKNFHQQK